MNYGYIYIIRNNINNKIYVGQTLRSVEERFKEHLKSSKSKQYYKIYKAMNKYGKENFYYEILEKNVPEDIINEREIYWIEYFDSFRNGYNSTPGGDGRVIFKDIDIEYLIEELKKGKMIKELAEEFDVNAHTITRTLQRHGYKTKDIQNTKIAKSKAQIKIDREKVLELYNKGYNVNEIAEELKCDTKTIRRIKHELNLDFERPRYNYDNIIDENIIKDKINGMKVKNILEKYNISYCYYYKLWKEYRTQKEKSNDYPDRE